MVSIINGRLDQLSEKITLLRNKAETHTRDLEDLSIEHNKHKNDIESYITMEEMIRHVEINEFTSDLNYLLTAITTLKDETLGTKAELNELIYKKFVVLRESLAKS